MRTPTLSVIVCTYNREEYIGECLTRLASQNIDKTTYEVLVINNNSTDNSQRVIDSIARKYSEINFLSFIEEKQGLTYARNRGIKESSGVILSFLDDDAFADSDYCARIIESFAKHKTIAAIGGKIVPKYESEEPRWMSPYLLPLVASLDLGNEARPFRYMKFPIGANMAFRKSAFEKYGIFDTELGRRGAVLEGGEEKEMFIRLKKAKEEIWYFPGIAVSHIIPAHRVKKSYVKGLAKGVGTSERKRISKERFENKLGKAVSEIMKIAGTIVLSVFFAVKGSRSQAIMLIKFRYWVVSALLSGKK
jgi:glycosyltransferase involved in cell wall biosynthesis